MRTSLFLLLPLLLPLAASAQSFGTHQTPAAARAGFAPPNGQPTYRGHGVPGAHPTPAEAAASFAPRQTVNVDAPADASGRSVHNWISLQESGTRSVQDTPPLPGTIASKIYTRYANSFTHAIPDHFSQQTFSSGGGS